MFCGNFMLMCFDGIIIKFDNFVVVEVDQVIVVMLLCQFKYGFIVFKIVVGDDISVVKLVQYVIYCSQINFFIYIDQMFV